MFIFAFTFAVFLSLKCTFSYYTIEKISHEKLLFISEATSFSAIFIEQQATYTVIIQKKNVFNFSFIFQ
jgi:hypothetical protein